MNDLRRHRARSMLLLLLVLALTAASGCGDDHGEDPADTATAGDATPGDDTAGVNDTVDGPPTIGRRGLFDAAVTEVALEVDYQSGAAPFTQGGTRLDDPWQLFHTNAEALFDGHKTVVAPRDLADMQELSEVTGEDFTSADILAIADAHWDDKGSASRRVFYVVFLDGYFADDSGRRDTVLGVSIGDRGVIAMFKPVVSGSLVEAFVEQTTLVHEFGHAIGLVNNGIAITSEHHDAEHGAHCSNRDCVMYYLNEGASDMLGFVRDHIVSGATVVFGQECLDDASAAVSSGSP